MVIEKLWEFDNYCPFKKLIRWKNKMNISEKLMFLTLSSISLFMSCIKCPVIIVSSFFLFYWTGNIKTIVHNIDILIKVFGKDKDMTSNDTEAVKEGMLFPLIENWLFKYLIAMKGERKTIIIVKK